MPQLPPPAVSALLRFYERHLAASATMTSRLRNAGLLPLDDVARVPLGLVPRTVAPLLRRLSNAQAHAWCQAWREAGLLGADDRLRDIGAIVAALHPIRGGGVELLALAPTAVTAPCSAPVAVPATRVLYRTARGIHGVGLCYACSDPFDAALVAATGHAVLTATVGADASPADIAALWRVLAYQRPSCLHVACAATAAGARAADAWRTAAREVGIPVEESALPIGCSLRGIHQLHGAEGLRRVLSGLPITSVPPVPRPSARPRAIRAAWAGAAVPLAADLSAYVAHLGARGHSRHEVQRRALAIGHFWMFCCNAGRDTGALLEAEDIEAFQHVVVTAATAPAPARSLGAARRIVASLRGFLGWGLRTGRLPRDLASALVPIPRSAVPPPLVLSAEEVERALACIATATPTGLRDRAMLELLYSTGIRRGELAGLDVGDVDFARCILRVRRGKGGRSRLVPLGRRAASWLHRYLDDGRPRALRRADEAALFLSRRGVRIGVKMITARMHACLRRAGLTKGGSCHIVRHSVATLMHEAGADIRDLQALLGHALLTSTQLYTRVSLQHLQAVHRRTHPTELGLDGFASNDWRGQR